MDKGYIVPIVFNVDLQVLCGNFNPKKFANVIYVFDKPLKMVFL